MEHTGTSVTWNKADQDSVSSLASYLHVFCVGLCLCISASRPSNDQEGIRRILLILTSKSCWLWRESLDLNAKWQKSALWWFLMFVWSVGPKAWATQYFGLSWALPIPTLSLELGGVSLEQVLSHWAIAAQWKLQCRAWKRRRSVPIVTVNMYRNVKWKQN